MSVPEFAGTLVTVFVGAFLAFFLENLRERRRLKEWLRQYLDQSATMLGHTETVFPQVATMLDDMQTELDGWVAPSPTVPDWDVLNGVPVSRAPDLLGSLQGEALSVVRPGVLTSLVAVETSARTLELVSTRLESFHDQYVLPLVIRQQVTLTESDRAGLLLFRSKLADFRLVVSQCAADIAHALQQLRAG